MFQKDQIPELLANGVKVLIYAGDCDFICNWIGNKAWTLYFKNALKTKGETHSKKNSARAKKKKRQKHAK